MTTTTRTYDQSSVDCRIFSFREGLLSAIAHDLELQVTKLSLSVQVDEQSGQPTALTLRCESGSLRVVTALRDGQPLPGALSAADRQKIEHNLSDEVLHSGRYPEVRLEVDHIEPSPTGFSLRGVLHLHGQQRPLQATTRKEDGKQVAEVVLSQPDYGITPFRAMLGTLRVRPDLRVRVSVPWPG